VQDWNKGVVETNKIILVSVVPMQCDSSIIVDDSEDVLAEYELASCCHDVGEGQNGKKWALVQISACNMGLISRICIKGIAGYHWHFSCDYHNLILIVQHKASETKLFNNFQDNDTIMRLSFIEVGTKHYIIT